MKDTPPISEIPFKEYLVPADMTKLRCVDERKANQTNGVQIQGASSGIVDALKVVLNMSEDDAWNLVKQKGLPLDGHDDNSHGPLGCGYNKKVETDHAVVLAPEEVPAASRLERIDAACVLHYQGEHTPMHATINFVPDTTLDTNRILSEGQGTFNLDAWSLVSYAQKLELSHNQTAQFVSHIVDSYKATVTALANITKFSELR